MVQKYPLKGIHTVKAKGHTYWYAWRGGPRLHGQPGSPEFHASYNEAIAERYMPEPGKFRSLVMLYKTSSGYQELAASTKTHWGPWLNRIADDFGMLSIVKFNKPEMVRPLIRQWRNRWADKPRAADMGMEVLSRVLSYAVELGKIAGNPCEGIKGLYSSDRSDIIWTDTDIARIKAVGSPELRHAIDLAAATGLRRGALLRLSWSHVRDDENCIIPGMGNTTILANSLGRPWTGDGFGTMVTKAKAKAGIGEELHFHDLRGTAATKFYTAGLPEPVIAEILGWTEKSVENIIRKYVGRDAATKAIIRQLNEKRK
jgi:integrase